MSGEAGKGDTYRPVNKKKFDETYERVYGHKDFMDFHKDKTSKPNKTTTTAS